MHDKDGVLLHAYAYPLCMLSLDDIACIILIPSADYEYSLISQHLNQQATKTPHVICLQTCGDRGVVMEGSQ